MFKTAPIKAGTRLIVALRAGGVMMVTSMLEVVVVVEVWLLIARDNTEGWGRNSRSSKSAPTLKETKFEYGWFHECQF